jgi:hypothetical protein
MLMERITKLSFDEWVDLGRKLHRSSSVLSWYIGDWWIAGERRYGDRAQAAAMGIFAHGFGAMVNMGTVCRKFESPRRRGLLSFSHHAEVAALLPEKADAFLDHAQHNEWSKGELRKQITIDRLMTAGLIDQAAKDPEVIGILELVRIWNKVSPDARRKFLTQAKKAGDVQIGSDSLSRWTDDERARVRDAVINGASFDEVRALLPHRSVKGVMWVYYGERAMLDDYEELKSSAEEDAYFERNAKEGSAALYMALLQHHPELVLNEQRKAG